MASPMLSRGPRPSTLSTEQNLMHAWNDRSCILEIPFGFQKSAVLCVLSLLADNMTSGTSKDI
jgi:hypothetical protein